SVCPDACPRRIGGERRKREGRETVGRSSWVHDLSPAPGPGRCGCRGRSGAGSDSALRSGRRHPQAVQGFGTYDVESEPAPPSKRSCLVKLDRSMVAAPSRVVRSITSKSLPNRCRCQFVPEKVSASIESFVRVMTTFPANRLPLVDLARCPQRHRP